jgi:hypothetical protein
MQISIGLTERMKLKTPDEAKEMFIKRVSAITE